MVYESIPIWLASFFIPQNSHMTTRGPEIMEISRPTEEDPAARAARTAAAGAEAAAFLQQASRSSRFGGSSSFLWKKWKDLDWDPGSTIRTLLHGKIGPLKIDR